jgi:hypothetical protein
MADKEIHHHHSTGDGGAGASMGMIAGILFVVALLVLGGMFFFNYDRGGSSVTVEAPKITAPATTGQGGGPAKK